MAWVVAACLRSTSSQGAALVEKLLAGLFQPLFEVAALNGSMVIEVGAGAIPRELAERVSPREP